MDINDSFVKIINRNWTIKEKGIKDTPDIPVSVFEFVSGSCNVKRSRVSNHCHEEEKDPRISIQYPSDL